MFGYHAAPAEKHEPVLDELNVEGLVKKLKEIRSSNESKADIICCVIYFVAYKE